MVEPVWVVRASRLAVTAGYFWRRPDPGDQWRDQSFLCGLLPRQANTGTCQTSPVPNVKQTQHHLHLFDFWIEV